MHFSSPGRKSRAAVAVSIALLLIAMLLPVCHLHPLLDKTAPAHCTICVSLHAATPVGVHAPPPATLQLSAERVSAIRAQGPLSFTPHFSASRAPPSPAC